MLIVFCHSGLHAQDTKLAGFSYCKFTDAKIHDIPQDLKVRLDEYRFFFNIPKVLKNEKTTLINGLHYSMVKPIIGNDTIIGLNRESLHIVGYRFIVLQKIQKKWAAIVYINPILSSSLNDPLSSKDFIFNGSVQLVKKVSEGLAYGFGIARNARLGEPLYLPTLMFRKTSKKSKLNILLPNMISYERFYGKFALGIKAEVSGSLYRVNSTRINAQNEPQTLEKLSYFRAVIGPKIEYKITELIRLEVFGGTTVARRVDALGDEFGTESYNVVNSPFFQIGLFVVPSEKMKNKKSK